MLDKVLRAWHEFYHFMHGTVIPARQLLSLSYKGDNRLTEANVPKVTQIIGDRL